MAASLTIRQRVIEHVRRTVAELPDIGGAAYDQPIDHARPDLPYGWVYDDTEDTDLGFSTDHFRSTLALWCIVAYRFSDDGYLRRGNEWLAVLKRGLLADPKRGRNEDTGAPLAFNTVYTANDIKPLPEAENVAVVGLRIEVEYFERRGNPWAQ